MTGIPYFHVSALAQSGAHNSWFHINRNNNYPPK